MKSDTKLTGIFQLRGTRSITVMFAMSLTEDNNVAEVVQTSIECAENINQQITSFVTFTEV